MNYKKMTVMYTIVNIFYVFSLWILTVITTKVLDYTVAGHFTLAMSVGNVFFTLQLFGVRSFQVSDIRGEYSSSQYIYARFVTTFAGILLCIVYCVIFVHEGEKIAVIIAYMMFRSSEAVSDVYYGELQKIGRLDTAAKSMFFKSLFMLVLFPVVLCMKKELIAALLAVAISAILVTLFYDRWLFSILVSRMEKWSGWKKVCAPIYSCVGLMFTNIFPIIVTALPRIILERYSGSEILGYYGNVSAPTVIITTVIPSALVPIMTWYGQMIQSNKLRKVCCGFVKSLLACIAFGILACAAVWIMGNQVMALIFTDAIIPYVHYMYSLIAVTVICACTTCANAVLIAMRKTKAVSIYSGISFVCAAVTVVPLVKKFNIYGAIMVLGISYFVQLVLQITALAVHLKKRMDTDET